MIETDLNCVNISNDRRLLAVADALGAPKIYSYPAHLPNQSFISLDPGHINQVISAKFTPDDNFLMTLGEADNTILIWNY